MKTKLELHSYSEECHYFKEGKLYFECKLPNSVYKRISKGPYKNLINQYSANLILINRERSIEDIIKHMCDINREYLNNSVDLETLTSIVTSNYNNPGLQPFHTRIKFFWVDPSIDNKYSAYNNKRSELLEDKLEKALEYIRNSDYIVTHKELTSIIPLYLIKNNKDIINKLNEGKVKKNKDADIIMDLKKIGLSPKEIHLKTGIGLSKVKNHYYK